MAKKSGGTTARTIDIVDVSAYIALVLAAIVFLITAIMRAFDATATLIRVTSVLTLVKDIAVALALMIGAYNFARKRSITIRVFFYIAIVTYIVCMIVGVSMGL